MKLLKIDNNQGLFLDDGGKFRPLDKITKDDLLRLVDLTLDDDVEFDEFNEDSVKNQAHQILYRSIHERLTGLKARQQEFIDESERLYLKEYEKYQDELSESNDHGNEYGAETAQ